jgi:hypothetical protein
MGPSSGVNNGRSFISRARRALASAKAVDRPRSSGSSACPNGAVRPLRIPRLLCNPALRSRKRRPRELCPQAASLGIYVEAPSPCVLERTVCLQKDQLTSDYAVDDCVNAGVEKFAGRNVLSVAGIFDCDRIGAQKTSLFG